jgi:hypothetical protein
LINRLNTVKANASAESMRVFEYNVPPVPNLTRSDAQAVFPLLKDNYGLAGHIYAQYLVDNIHQIKIQLKEITSFIEKRLNISNPERFWAATVSVALLGGIIAKKLGLINFDMDKIVAWIDAVFNSMRVELQDNVRTPAQILMEFMDIRMAGAIIVQVSEADKGMTAVVKNLQGVELSRAIAKITYNYNLVVQPRAPICMRIENNLYDRTAKAYIARKDFKRYCSEQGVNLSAVIAQLRAAGIMEKRDMSKTLGFGTQFETGSVPVYAVNLRHRDIAESNATEVVDSKPTRVAQITGCELYG